MRKPYRIIVWGPGSLGRACLSQIFKRPEFELVGVLAFNPDKDGKDVAEIMGIEPTGIIMTTDKDRIIEMDADVVLHCTKTMAPPDERDADVIRLLESGKNIISGASYHYPPDQGEEYTERFESACQRGGVTLHGTGIHPNFADRMIMTLSGLMTEIEHIRFQEMIDASNAEALEPLMAAGFGQDPKVHESAMAQMPDSQRELFHAYYRGISKLLAVELFGKPMDRFTSETSCTVADEDLQVKAMLVPAGTTVALTHTYKGYIGDHNFYTNEEYYYLTPKYCPIDGVKGELQHAVTIEGKPCSVKADISFKASIEHNLEKREGDDIIQAYYTTAMPMIQAIAVVCDATPGILYQSVFSHFANDFRRLARDPV